MIFQIDGAIFINNYSIHFPMLNLGFLKVLLKMLRHYFICYFMFKIKKRPYEKVFLFATNQLAVSKSMLRICPMALVGFRPLGHTDTQFMIPRQRNKLNGSSRRANLARVSVSRLSMIKR